MGLLDKTDRQHYESERAAQEALDNSGAYANQADIAALRGEIENLKLELSNQINSQISAVSTAHIWFRYSSSPNGKDENGNALFLEPEDEDVRYIGIVQGAVSERINSPSSFVDNPENYEWSLTKGTEGKSLRNLGELSEEPSNPEDNDMYYNTVTKTTYQYAGDSVGWIILATRGEIGATGEPLYTWIRYADDINGTGISDSPAGKNFIGFSYNQASPTESDDPADYMFSDIKGEEGVAGANGYTWIKYADNQDPGFAMYQQPTSSTEYIGIANNKDTAQENDNGDTSVYTWSKFKGDQGVKGDEGAPGPQGDTGPQGPDGISIEDLGIFKSFTHLEAVLDDNGTTVKENNIVKIAPQVDGQSDEDWIANKDTLPGTVWIYSIGAWTVMVNDGTDGLDGATGPSGISVFIVYNSNALDNQPSIPTNADIHEGTKAQADSAGKIWYTDPEPSSVWVSQKRSESYETGTWSPVLQFRGSTGAKGEDGASTYTWIKYADDDAGNGLSDSPVNKDYIGFAYNKDTSTESEVASNYTWSKIKGEDGVDGDEGIPGPRGADGLTPYTWIKHSPYVFGKDSGGNSVFTLSSDASTKYIGISVNNTVATESNDADDYSWSKFRGDDGVSGAKGDDGKMISTGVLHYQIGTSVAPSTPSSSGTVFNFDTGLFSNLPSNWDISSPQMEAGTASNNYWTSHYKVVESSAGSGTGTPSFSTPVKSFTFDQVVTFNSLATEGSTEINGGNITTGIIKNDTFVGQAAWDTFSNVGTGINLDLGAINGKNFFIAPDGTSSFKGAHDSGTIGGWEINSGAIRKVTANGSVGLNSSRSAVEVKDSQGAIAVDINNNGSLSSFTGASHSSSLGSTSNSAVVSQLYQFANVPGIQLSLTQSTEVASSGQDSITISSPNNQAVGVRCQATNFTIAEIDIRNDEGGQGTLEFPINYSVYYKYRMDIVRDSDSAVVGSMYSEYQSPTISGIGHITDTVEADLDLSTAITASSSGFHVKAYLEEGRVDIGASGVNLYGDLLQQVTFKTPVFDSVTAEEDSNKTEITSGGFQVVKGISEYFRADRTGSSWIDSSGVWNHNGNITQTSDINQKYNINPINVELSDLDRLGGYTYSQIINPINSLNNISAKDIHIEETAGLIAQEIEAILPSAVFTNNEGAKSLDYSAASGLLLELIKKLNTKVKSLEEEINKLKQNN